MAGLPRILPDVSTRLYGLVRVKSAATMRWLRESQWIIAFLASLLGTLLGYLMVMNARRISAFLAAEAWLTTVAEARTILLAFIGVEITALSIVMSLTMITLQSAASQFSNRLLRYYISDRVQQTVFGVIAGSTAYFVAVAALLGIEHKGAMPRPSLGLAVLLLMASGVALIVQVNHTMQMVRLEVILGWVVRATAGALSKTRRIYAEVPYVMGAAFEMPESAVHVLAHQSGYVAFEEIKALLKMAANHRYLVSIDVEVGNHVLKGTPVGKVQPDDPNEIVPESVLLQVSESLGVNSLRNPSVDAGLGLRLLVDIAVKALSPSVNDPYTAGKAIDHIASTFTYLLEQDLGEHTLLDQEGNPRVLMCGRTLFDYLGLATDQIARYGAHEPLVVLRLLKLARDVGTAAQTETDKAGAIAVIDATMDKVEAGLREARWLETLHVVAEEAKIAIINDRIPAQGWPVEL